MDENLKILSLEEKEIKKTKKWIKIMFTSVVFFIIPILFIFILIHIANYGFNIKPCPYREKTLAIPDSLKGAKVVFDKDYFLNKPEEYGTCSPIMGSAKWVSDSGYGGEKILSGTELEIKYVIAQTKYGFLQTIDSGGGPWFEYILSDNKGNFYSMFSIYFNRSYEPVLIYKDGKKVTPPGEDQLKLLYSK